jgi:energy-converting hydrogenase A subunit R
LEDVIYVGDSITDVEAFRLVKNHGGLTVSFNGNRYAVKEAEVAVLSESSLVTSVIAELFAFHGKEGTLEILERWGREALRKCNVSKELLEKVFRIFPERLPKVELITDENVETLTLESEEFRKRVRGEVVGGLG